MDCSKILVCVLIAIAAKGEAFPQDNNLEGVLSEIRQLRQQNNVMETKLHEMEIRNRKLENQIKELQSYDQKLQTQMNEFVTDVATIKRTPTPYDNYVGFTAYVTDHDNQVSSDQQMVFQTVVSNYGGYYDNTNGEFTCTISGWYAFFVTCNSGGGSTLFLKLQKDGSDLIYGFGDGAHWDTGSNMAVIECGGGSKVRVMVGDDGGQLHGNRLTSFSGFLLQTNLKF